VGIPSRADRRKRRARLAGALLALAGSLAACSPGPPEETGDYVERITRAREAKDQFMRSDPESPVPAARKDELLPLLYYPIDPDYNVAASLIPGSTTGSTIQMQTSTGSQVQMRRVGTLEFTLKGRKLSLTAFNEVGSPDLNHLFVPFMDLTNRTETYEGGRFLDLERTATGLYELDFNRAYNPNCYFDVSWICPIPPPENRLDLAIEAGEKVRTT
jgi:uncharacterized protein (DUF1684 family)